jgi:exosortase
MVDSLSAASLVLAVPGAAWLALGCERLRGLWPVLWLTAFAVPAPIYVEGRAAFVLKELAVTLGHALGNLLGADLVRDGSLLRRVGGNDALWVADACGGLRSLLALLTLGYVLAFFSGSPARGRRCAVLLAAVPIAIAANVVRIALLCLFARWSGVPFAEGTGHTLANVAEWVVAVGTLLAFDALLQRRWPTPPRAAAGASGAVAADVGRRVPRRVAASLWLAAVPLLALSLWRPAAAARDRAATLPSVLAGWQLIPRSEAQEGEFQRALPRWIELLGTPDFTWRRYRDTAGRRINLVALFHDTNWKSVHAPQICIEGSGMDIEVDDVVPAPWLGEGGRLGRIVAESRRDGWRYVTLCVFGTRTWSGASYGEFSWHHAPRALLRANESGFLLRAEAPVERGETDADAQVRAAAFLQRLLPVARERL